jgi:phage terminase large subunit-like protein
MANKETRSERTAKQAKHPPTDHARNYSQIAYDYAAEAVADKKGKKFCKFARKAAKRHLEDLKKSKRYDWPYRFDEWHGNDVCDFAEKCPHVEGEWDTKTLTLEPAQIFILVSVFGWRRKRDGRRRFSHAYIEMARKNAKSTLTAVVALYCLTCEGELGPQIIIGATTGEQANKVFGPAKRMVERTADLREAFNVEAWSRSITCAENGGFIQPINAKSSTQDGWNPHVSILDELHAHKDRGLYDVLRSAAGARKNPLMWKITTAGYNTEGVCYEQRTLVTKILDEIVEADHYFGIIFTLDEGDDPLDESVWIKANPLLEVSVQIDEMRGYAKEARASPDSMGEFKTKRLNVWVTARSAWLNMESWKKCAGRVTLEELVDVPCFGALDLGSTSDITAFVLLWLLDGRVKVWGRYYLPEDVVMPRTERGNVPYQRWAADGLLVTTLGNVTDYAYVEKDVRESMQRFRIKEIAYDPWNATQVVNNLTADGAPMVEFIQGPKSFNSPMKDLERRIAANTLDHGGDPVLAWMASNLVARKDVNSNLAPDKRNSQEKIDGMVATLMALGRAISTTTTTEPKLVIL